MTYNTRGWSRMHMPTRICFLFAGQNDPRHLEGSSEQFSIQDGAGTSKDTHSTGPASQLQYAKVSKSFFWQGKNSFQA